MEQSATAAAATRRALLAAIVQGEHVADDIIDQGDDDDNKYNNFHGIMTITMKIFRLAEDFSSEGGERCIALYSYSGEAESSMGLRVLLR